MTRALVVLVSVVSMAACIPTLSGAPCSDDLHCPADQFCSAGKCAVGARSGGGTGTTGGGGAETGGGTGGGGGGGGSETGGGTATGGSGGGGSEVDAGIDAEAPVVIATTPTNGSATVSVSTTLVIEFSEPMRPASVVYVTSNGVTYGAPTWNAENTRITLQPSMMLEYGTSYSVSVNGQDVAGNTMASSYSYTFSTEATPDTTAPSIEASIPETGDLDVPTTTEIMVSFSEPMLPGSVMLSATPSITFGTPTWADNNTEYSISATGLTPSTAYTVLFAGTDVAGNPLPTLTTISFTTAAPPDVTPPSMTASTPLPDAGAVLSTRTLSFTFNEAMNTGALVVNVDPDPGIGAPTWTMGNTRVEYTNPTAPWDYSTTYRVDVNGLDVAGNTLPPTSFRFTTEAEPDTTPPTVTSTSPTTGVMTFPYSGNIEFNFSEPMNTAATEAAFNASPTINCEFTWNTAHTLMSCNPTTDLTANTSYNVTLGVGARDNAGLALAMPYQLTFRTASAPDTTKPTITATNPAHNSVGAPRMTLASSFPIIRTRPAPITVTFSEPMNQLSAQGAFTVTSPAGYNGGTFAWSGNTMSYTPPDYFDYGDQVTFTISGGATDVAGNTMGTAVTRTFRVRRRTTVKLTNVAASSALDGYIYSNTACSSVSVAAGSTVVFAGDRYATSNASQNTYRGYLTFSLTPLNSYPNVSITTAHLYARQNICFGTPYSSTFGGAIEAWHVNYGPSLEAADCNTANLSNRQYTLSTDATEAFKSTAVTAAVGDDWTNRSARGFRSQFLIRTANLVSDGDTSYDYCSFSTFNASTTTNRPYLQVVIEYD